MCCYLRFLCGLFVGAIYLPPEILADEVESKEVVNSIGMKLVLIPAGEFQMGAENVRLDQESFGRRFDNGAILPSGNGMVMYFPREQPVHRVRITKAFYLGRFEVTQSEYEAVMWANPSKFKSTRSDRVLPSTAQKLARNDFPVESVSWEDAVGFCKKLSSWENRVYRLPTEAEWEYACRAGTKTTYSNGDSLRSRDANFNGTDPFPFKRKMVGPYLRKTTPVGSYQPNAFGLYDMHGNVSEWCYDFYDGSYYEITPSDDPPGPPTASVQTDRVTGAHLPAKGDFHVYRGGAWNAIGAQCRSASRGSRGGKGVDYIGFRVVLVP